ncbi:MAG TPA: pyridoxal-dependent decarboxylase [Gemmatimonadaceae bacterium]|nr:pyridoxal-dependent decarboxylase [Gemmatimonadaceae bacterium]
MSEPTSQSRAASGDPGAPPKRPDAGHDTGDLPLSELSEHGHAALAWIERYLAEPERHPVLSRAAPGDTGRALPSGPPAHAEPLERILADFERSIVPGITHWNHPGFLAYFATTGSVPGIIGELLASALNVNAMLWRTSPAVTELELLVTDWLRQMLGLDDGWFGFLNDTASVSTLLALAAAREARPELAIRERGMAGRTDLPRLRVYCSTHAHSSVDKAAIALGLGHENVVHIEADERFALRADSLAEAMAADSDRGALPLAVVATAGTTSTTSVDPIAAIAPVARRHGAWLHVDAAYAGVAAVLPELRARFTGWEQADSIVVNPHKWMFTPIGASALFVRRPDILRRAFSLVPEYLTTTDPQDVPNLMDYGIQLGRPFRALKMWMVIRAFGTEGIARRIRHHLHLARRFADLVEGSPDWQLAAPVPFSTICFRFAPAGVDDESLDRRNAAILERVNAGGEAFLSHTRLHGRYVLRVAIGNLRTEWEHLERTWELLGKASVESIGISEG